MYDEDFNWPFIIVFVVIVLLTWMVYAECADEYRLKEQCMKDHKEYECVAMLRDNTPSTTVIYTGR